MFCHATTWPVCAPTTSCADWLGAQTAESASEEVEAMWTGAHESKHCEQAVASETENHSRLPGVSIWTVSGPIRDGPPLPSPLPEPVPPPQPE